MTGDGSVPQGAFNAAPGVDPTKAVVRWEAHERLLRHLLAFATLPNLLNGRVDRRCPARCSADRGTNSISVLRDTSVPRPSILPAILLEQLP